MNLLITLILIGIPYVFTFIVILESTKRIPETQTNFERISYLIITFLAFVFLFWGMNTFIKSDLKLLSAEIKKEMQNDIGKR